MSDSQGHMLPSPLRKLLPELRLEIWRLVTAQEKGLVRPSDNDEQYVSQLQRRGGRVRLD